MDYLDYNDDFKKRYFDDETWARLQRHRAAAQQLRIYVRQAWLKLFRDVEAVLDADPRSEKAGDLARRWHELWQISTFGDPRIQEAQVKAWKDRTNWPAEAREMVAKLNLEKVAPFIAAAIAHHRVRALGRRGQRSLMGGVTASLFRYREPLSQESVEQVLRPWIELLREGQELLGHEPSTLRVQALVSRWNKLWQSTPRYDFRMKAVLRDALADAQKWPPSLRAEVAPLDLARIAEFMKQAIAASMKKRYRDSTDTGMPSQAWTDLWQRLCRNVGLA